jgi:hypothetical protein
VLWSQCWSRLHYRFNATHTHHTLQAG